MPTTQILPLTYALTLGTTSTQIVPPNPTRKGILFHNPGPNSVAVCPSLNNQMQPVAAVINGAGSLTIVPGGVLSVPPQTWVDALATCGWNGIASGAGSPFTAWEF